QELEKIESEYKYSKEALRETENLFKMLYEKAPLGYQSLDENGHFIVVNQTWLDTLGYTREEVIGKSFADFLHPDWRDHFKENFPRFKSIGEVLGVEFEMVKKNGDLILVSFTGKINRDKKGNFQQTHCIFHDITDRKRMEKALRESEEKYRILFEHTGEALFVAQDARIVFQNPRSTELLGYSAEEFQSKPFFDFIHEDDREMVTDHHIRRLRGEKLPERYNFRIIHKNGSILWAELNAVLFQWNGRPAVLCFMIDITKRKQIEDGLIESEALFRGMFKGHSAVMLLIDPNTGRIIMANQAAAQYYGYPLEKMLQMKIQQLNVLSPAEITEQMRCALNKQANIFEFQHLLSDGQIRAVEVHSAPITIQHQTLLFSIIRDITDRKQAEEALRESNKTAHQFFSESSAGSFFMMLDEPIEWTDSVDKEKILDYVFDHQRITKINRAMLDHYLASEKDFLYMTPKQLFAHDLEHGRLLWRKMFDQGFLDIESDERRFDGSQMWIIGSYRCMYDEQGRIIGHFGTQFDITERKRAEAKLRLQSLVLDQIEDRVTVTDLNGAITYVNDAEVRAFGYSRDELIGFTTDKYGDDPERGATQRQIIEETLEKGAWRGEVVNQTVAGEDVILDCRTSLVLDEQGNKIALAGISTDITDLKKMETQLNQAQKMESVGRLAGGVAHDFNNMLGVILGHTELALLHTDDKHKLCSDLKEIQKAAERSADITKQLLAFARKEIISPKQLDLNDTVESMLNMLRRLIGEDIDLVWQPTAHLWPVKMDPSQIDQILANLCVNARDAIAGVGKLTIETGKKSFDEQYCNEHPGFIPGNFVLLAVSDNGCGMEKHTLDNLFEPFFTTKEVGKGTGLGLATVYGIVKQNNGFINVYSEPGQGSTFNIYLPRFSADEDTDKAVPEKKAAAGGTETILLVEDEPTILRMTRMMLERKGYTVLSAATPTEAMEKAKNHSGAIALLMTDVVMPEMNGRDLSGQITDLYPDIRLLFMSGYTADVIAHQGILDDGVAFIQKPFSMADMTEKVREVLDMAPDKN
ncbi:MAG: PAS domain S-box protein, partial [Desulfotignum sp.]